MNGKLPRQIISQLERESKWVLYEKERERLRKRNRDRMNKSEREREREREREVKALRG